MRRVRVKQNERLSKSAGITWSENSLDTEDSRTSPIGSTSPV